MERPCVLAFLNDPGLEHDLQEAVEVMHLDIYFAMQGEHISQLAKTYHAILLIVDLTVHDPSWLFKHIHLIKNANARFPIIGLVPVFRDDLRDRAEKSGCTLVLTKPEFAKKYQELIPRYVRLMS